MNSSFHSSVQSLISFCETWSGNACSENSQWLDPSVRLVSSHRGTVSGRENVTALLQNDFADLDNVSVTLTNTVERRNDKDYVASAYLHGQASRKGSGRHNQVRFGGTVVMRAGTDESQPVIHTLHLQITWTSGARQLLSGWLLPAEESGWHQGFPQVAIISELDAPWHIVPENHRDTSEEQGVIDTWYRYAWALDQADFKLFSTCFSENAAGNFTPLGYISGRRNIIAAMKAFRLPWPWMQHYGEPLKVCIQSDRQSAILIIGRIIAEKTHDSGEREIYGAHYRVGMEKDSHNRWSICWSEYNPGWLSTDDVSGIDTALPRNR
ncbi:nuclear transport factor 2 family protein [[Curtobacterium] plantarum]|uniref:nuclear transport factor 2 family protein n=1 Tax=[Curtobacterium] plantarum TaxID=221276 RepID=UPI0021D7C96B|nr:nuclear transport factor 2 family protein [[Curtobacterium] plantarum]